MHSNENSLPVGYFFPTHRHWSKDTIVVIMILGLIAYWTPHHDSVTSLAVCERMEKTLIISASSDCCVILSDIKGSQKWLFRIPIACNTCRHWTWGYTLRMYTSKLGSYFSNRSKNIASTDFLNVLSWKPNNMESHKVPYDESNSRYTCMYVFFVLVLPSSGIV